MEKTAKIVKRKAGYHVISKKGKNLGGPYKSREAAVKRLQQVEYFKKHGEDMNLRQLIKEELMKHAACGTKHNKKDKIKKYIKSKKVK